MPGLLLEEFGIKYLEFFFTTVPNLFSVLVCIVFENSSKIVIVMEYASKGDLYDYISERQRLTEQEARHFFRQVVSAIYYCHKVSGKFFY